ncbi:MAG: hypothetical protein BGO51_06515 [Rhodospirillales bacterium 69-11]|nr:MAG: hypothetical protein BGO51_06515 [Rhodospirillales bacterium 69-11]
MLGDCEKLIQCFGREKREVQSIRAEGITIRAGDFATIAPEFWMSVLEPEDQRRRIRSRCLSDGDHNNFFFRPNLLAVLEEFLLDLDRCVFGPFSTFGAIEEPLDDVHVRAGLSAFYGLRKFGVLKLPEIDCTLGDIEEFREICVSRSHE